MWEWTKNTPEDLARYTLPQAAQELPDKVLHPRDILLGANGYYLLAQAIYDALRKWNIDYVGVAYTPHAHGVKQLVRTPAEIKKLPEATCLDLSLLYCGVCLHYELLPVVIYLEGHALAAVSLTHGRRTLESIVNVWRHGPVTPASPYYNSALSDLKDTSRYVVVECTGFAYTDTFPADDPNIPEGWSRSEGKQDFAAAVRAGLAQLDNAKRPVKSAIHIAYSQRHRGYEPQFDTTPPMNQAREVKEGVMALRALENLFPTIRTAIRTGRKNLAEIDRHISELNTYKGLHTQLHYLYFTCYNTIRTKIPDLDTFDEMDIDYDDLPGYAKNLEGIVIALQQLAQPFNAITEPEAAWITQIEQAYAHLTDLTAMSVAPECRLVKLQMVITLLRTVTFTHPSRINDKLYSLLTTLPLPQLKQAMLHVRTAIDKLKKGGMSPPPSLVEPYEEGIRQLDNLADALRQLLVHHHIMQYVDTRLREIEENHRYLQADFADIWKPIDAEAQKCYRSSQEIEAAYLRQKAERLKETLNSETYKIQPGKVEEGFLKYRSHAGHLFFAIDKRLMDMCNDLEQIRRALSELWLTQNL